MTEWLAPCYDTPYDGYVRAALVINPACGDAESAQAAVMAASRRHGWQDPLVLATTEQQPGASQAQEALDAGVDRVVVAGGDGTLRQVAGVVGDVPVGVMPIGTANIVARNLRLPRHRLDKAAEVALCGVPITLSVGWVKCKTDGQWGQEMPMLAVAGIGRDAQAIATIKPWLKRHLGWLAYVESGGRAAFSGSLPMTVSLDGASPIEMAAWSVLVAAMPRLPLKVKAFFNVTPGDDSFEVLHVLLKRPREWWSVAAKGIAHTKAAVPALCYKRARQVLVRPHEPCAVQIDGDLISGVEQMSVRMQAGAVAIASGPWRA